MENICHLKPIRLLLSGIDGEPEILGSHFWGNPDLPAGFGYPEYTDSDGENREYQFICQINLEDIAGFDTGNILPPKGLLSFFAKIDHYLGYFDDMSYIGSCISSTDEVRVMYFPDTENTDFERIILIDENDAPVNPSGLRITFGNITDKHGTAADEHFLLAEPTHREWETWDHPYEDWIILLQIDSFSGKDFNLNFMDCGVLAFLIHPDDLRKRDFSKVRAIVLST